MSKVIRKTEQAHYTEEDLTIPELFALLSVIAFQKNTPLMNKVPCLPQEPVLPRWNRDYLVQHEGFLDRKRGRQGL